MRWPRSARGVMVLGLMIGALAAIRLLAAFDWNPTVFTAFGEDATQITEYAEQRLSRDVLTRPGQGHDGKYFFIQANDPWLLEPAVNAANLDRPEYRSRRMLYPTLAGGFGLFSPETILWAMPGINVVMLGVGSWAVSQISIRHNGPVWVGLAFALNIGLLSDLFIDSAGIVAFAFCALGVLWIEENRMLAAGAAFSAAVLSREAMALFVAFLALGWLARRGKVPWGASLPPAIALIAWEVYMRFGVDLPSVPSQDEALTLVPFSGVWAALSSGIATPIDYTLIGVFVMLILIVPYRALKSNVSFTWGAVGFALLGPFLTFPIWQKSFDISRALAPLVTVFIVEMFTKGVPREGDLSAAPPDQVLGG